MNSCHFCIFVAIKKHVDHIFSCSNANHFYTDDYYLVSTQRSSRIFFFGFFYNDATIYLIKSIHNNCARAALFFVYYFLFCIMCGGGGRFFIFLSLTILRIEFGIFLLLIHWISLFTKISANKLCLLAKNWMYHLRNFRTAVNMTLV